jgi:SAM-dependent methyltransferase
MYERAFPGMPRPDIISEHTSRYAYALSLIGGKHVLDLGCGTGYGSEMLSWSAASVRGFDLWQPAADEHPRWPGCKPSTTATTSAGTRCRRRTSPSCSR